MILRPHQETNLQQLREAVECGLDPLLVAPCGYGKGTLITFIVKSAVALGYSVIFAVHGKSLVADMSQRLTKLGIAHGVLMGGARRERWHPVQVASIDTLHRMEHPPAADLFIVDEAHMAMSPTWRKALERFPNARVIGMTATPIRLDKKGLGRKTGGLFDCMVLGPSEESLITETFLVGSRVLAPPSIDVSSVKKTAGDFNTKQLAQVCDKTKLTGDIVKHWQQYAPTRKTAAFGVDKAHAMHITEQFRSVGIHWEYVDADTDQRERQRIWDELDNGCLMGVSSVGCISVGWDHPVVSCLIMARPTASLGLWRQMLGRGSRPYEGKQDFLVLDHAGNTMRHAPYGFFEDEIPWCLDGEAIKPGDKPAPSITTCKQSVMHCPCPDPMGQHEGDGTHWPCYATFKSGPHECPYCKLPIVKKVKKVEIEQGELGEIKRLPRRAKTAEEWRAGSDGEKFAHYMELLEVQAQRSYKPNWASLKYHAIYNEWPGRDWKGLAGELPPPEQPSLFF